MFKISTVILSILLLSGCDTFTTIAYNHVGLKKPEVLIDTNKGTFSDCKNAIGDLLLPLINDRSVNTTILVEDNKNQRVDVCVSIEN